MIRRRLCAPGWRLVVVEAPIYSGLMPASLITFAHFAVSSAMNLAKSVGEPEKGGAPMAEKRALICGSASPALIAWLSLSTISAGVLWGAPMPFQPLAS